MDAETTDDQFVPRLRFYGAGDLATNRQMYRAAEVVEGFDPAVPPDEVNGILELHNARLFVEAGFIPTDVVEDDRKALIAAAKQIRRTVARWFGAQVDDNLVERLTQVDWQYREQLLDLLAGLGV